MSTSTIPEAYEQLDEAVADLIYMGESTKDVRWAVTRSILDAIERRDEAAIRKGTE